MVSQNCNETGVTATKKEKYKEKCKKKTGTTEVLLALNQCRQEQ